MLVRPYDPVNFGVEILTRTGKYLRRIEAERGGSFAEEVDAWEAVLNLKRTTSQETGGIKSLHDINLIKE